MQGLQDDSDWAITLKTWYSNPTTVAGIFPKATAAGNTKALWEMWLGLLRLLLISIKAQVADLTNNTRDKL
jgi:hypothetical protein